MIRFPQIKIKGVNGYTSILVICAFLLIGIQACVDSILPITEPSVANAGDKITITVPVTLHNEAFGPVTDNLIVAILVPKSWNADKTGNTTMTYASNLPNGNGSLIPMPATTTVPNSNYPGFSYPDFFKTLYGAGNNVVDDHEWIVFKTDKQFTLQSGQSVLPIITITTKVGTQNMLTKLGYAVTYGTAGADVGGTDSKVQLSTNCFAVINGTNPMLDFCNKPLTSVLPLSASDKDFITFSFDNDLKSTPLQDSTDIYLSAKAKTTDSTVIDNSTKLIPFTGIGGQKYTLVMYPRLFFNLQPNQTLAKISYYITNKSGTKVVTSTNSSPFVFTFTNCN